MTNTYFYSYFKLQIIIPANGGIRNPPVNNTIQINAIKTPKLKINGSIRAKIMHYFNKIIENISKISLIRTLPQRWSNYKVFI